MLLEFNAWVCSEEKHFSRRMSLAAMTDEALLGLMKYCLSQVKKQKGPAEGNPDKRGEIKHLHHAHK